MSKEGVSEFGPSDALISYSRHPSAFGQEFSVHAPGADFGVVSAEFEGFEGCWSFRKLHMDYRKLYGGCFEKLKGYQGTLGEFYEVSGHYEEV